MQEMYVKLQTLITLALEKLTKCNYDINNTEYKEYEGLIK